MWYRCEALRQSNQALQLQLLQKIKLMKICEFCEDMSKSKNIKRVSLIKYLDQNVFKILEYDEHNHQEIKISTRMKKFHFWVKYAIFIKNENEFLKNSDFCYTWSNDHTQ